MEKHANTKQEKLSGLEWNPEIYDAIRYHLAIIGRGADENGEWYVREIVDTMLTRNTLLPNDARVVPLLSRFLSAMHSGAVKRKSNSVEAHAHAFNEFVASESARREQYRPASAPKADSAVTPEQARRVLHILGRIYGADFPAFIERFEQKFPGFRDYIDRARKEAARNTTTNKQG